DGKTYPAVKITKEAYPRIYRTRNIIEDGSSYFGPFPNVNAIDRYLELIDKTFPLRKCKGPLKKRDNPCLYYHINRCSAPCCGKISREEYAARVEKIKDLLSGNIDGLVIDLTEKMHTAAGSLEFEKASELRDTIQSIYNLSDEQSVMDFSRDSMDYIAYAAHDELCTFCVFKVRGGKLADQDIIRTETYGHEDESVSQFFLRYYEERKPPETIYLLHSLGTDAVSNDAVSNDAGSLDELTAYFRTVYQSAIRTVTPSLDKHYTTAMLATKNCIQDLDRRKALAATVYSLRELKAYLLLPGLPERIEGFDISQLGGKHPVASQVSFYKGKPDKKNYRRFHVKTLGGAIDDYESIREVVSRRYTRVINEKLPVPDLILIDGGKGQLNAAEEILSALGLKIPVIGLAKRLEEIFTWDGRRVVLPETSAALRLLQLVRDEAHRFATDFNKRLRKKDLSVSLLEKVKGLGPVRVRKLLTHYSSLQNIAEDAPESIAAVSGVSIEIANNLVHHIKQNMKM
ncbi:MAG: excinuclease ABC subunit UvrC, partial [Spirochaetales bacterium]